MLSTQDYDIGVKYLLGELTEEEQAAVEERYFSDAHYFDELRKLEEDLLSQEIHVPPELDSGKNSVLKKIERLPEIEFTRQWLADVRTIIHEADPLEAAPAYDALLVRTLVNLYEAKLREAELDIAQQKTKNLLVDAWQDREFASALMENNWLGLKLLSALKSVSLLKTTQLAVMVNADIDTVVPTLIRLTQFGGLAEDGGFFSITERGISVIGNLESTIGSSL